MKLPAGYAWADAGPARIFAEEAVQAWATGLAAAGTTLYEWAASTEGASELRGRAPVWVVPAQAPGPDGRTHWAVRHYHRGGAIAPALVDRYFAVGPPRPVRELEASVEARARGVPTPAVVAGAVYREGLFYRADLVTEFVPNGRELADVVFDGDEVDASLVIESLRSAGRLVRCLEDARIVHPDLNAMNVLLTGEVGEVVAHALDLDRCVVWRIGTRRPADSMRRRLERSLRKLGDRHGRPLDREGWDALREGFGEA